MTKRTPPCDWTDLDWGQTRTKDTGRWIAVLPLAATEQHGPHLPLGTDIMIGEAYLTKVRDLLPASLPAVFLPIQPIGISTEHLDFPGTLTLPAETAIRSWLAIGESIARAGVKKLVMVTSHGGNSAAMTLVAQELRARFDMLAVTTSWSRFGTPDGLFTAEEIQHGIHGGAVETSIMLAACPQYVRTDRIASFTPSSIAMQGDYKWLNAHRPAPYAWSTQDLHPSGAVGDATQATADKGLALLTHGARAFCELLDDMHRFDPATLLKRPNADWTS